MKGLILVIIIVFFFFPMILIGQQPAATNPNNDNSILTFTPPDKINKGHQTRFRKRYYGVLDGKDIELVIGEKKTAEGIELIVNLIDLENRQIFRGTKIVTKKVHQIDGLLLQNNKGEQKMLESLFLHNYNPNFINLITAKGQVGYFFSGEEPAKSDFYAKPFKSTDSFRGIYDGRIDGRPAEMKIEKRAEGIQITIEDKEQKQKYWTYINHLPQGKRIFSVDSLYLKATTSAKELLIKKLILDKNNTQIISGAFETRKKTVGLFFIRKTRQALIVLPEFPWPPPQASDFLKLAVDTLTNVTKLGDVDSLITANLSKSGYQFRPNKYFYTPNGFALVTQIEQIDCEGKPLDKAKRWAVNISEFEKDFNLIDYLRSLSVEKDGRYRIFAFVVTDDLNPRSRIDPTLEEMEDWGMHGSAILPIALAEQKLTEAHYCRVYVYEFSKKEGEIQAEMTKKGKDKCWSKVEVHLSNSELFEDYMLHGVKK